MAEVPVCPFCEHRLEDDIPEAIEGSIKLRCPKCEQRYEYVPKEGSFPLDEDFGIKVTTGVLGPHIVTGSSTSEDDISLSRALIIGSFCCCTLAIIIPVIISLILSFF